MGSRRSQLWQEGDRQVHGLSWVPFLLPFFLGITGEKKFGHPDKRRDHDMFFFFFFFLIMNCRDADSQLLFFFFPLGLDGMRRDDDGGWMSFSSFFFLTFR